MRIILVDMHVLSVESGLRTRPVTTIVAALVEIIHDNDDIHLILQHQSGWQTATCYKKQIRKVMK